MKSKNYRPTITICLQPSLTCLMVLNICGKENTMKQNNPCYLFGMYEPDTDSVIVNAINNTYTAHLLLSVAKNVIQPSCSIHLMISRIYIGWHRKTFPNLLYYPCHKTKSIIYSLSLVIMKLDILIHRLNISSSFSCSNTSQ